VRALTLAAVGLLTAVAAQAQQPSGFDHVKHRRVFPVCTVCHAGAASAGAAMWPDSTGCVACHDGVVEKRVRWQTPELPRTNLAFDHVRHAGRATATLAAAGKAAPRCADCHTDAGLVAQRCFSCHGLQVAHLAAPDTACRTCHVPLAGATRLALADIARFPAPPSHRDPRFGMRDGHGALAAAGAQSCATCHAREFCLTCHASQVDNRAIAALASDRRSLALAGRLPAPPSHRPRFADRHAAIARAQPASCAGCHVRADCLECHRPNPGSAATYHAAGFLSRHPAAAYSRETSCSECHNPGQFCTTCHAKAGLVARERLRGGTYHDANPAFIAGHGRAARQNLETCVSCHVERDCLTCHSALGGGRVNPHGPGFDAARLKAKNPEVCTACHGVSIP
jgi:hypothetical protein